VGALVIPLGRAAEGHLYADVARHRRGRPGAVAREPRYNYMRKNFSAIVGYKVSVG
jgi:hypothetical protein